MSGFGEKIVHDGPASAGSFCARRDFLKGMLAAPAFLRVLLAGSFELRLGIIYDDASTDALRGARMSVRESTRAAALLGANLTAVELRLKADTTAGKAAAWLASNHVAAVVTACTSPRLAQLLEPLMRAHVVAVNAAAPPDTVPGLCKTDVLSVVPAGSRQSQGTVVWDATLERFGAAQLNARYQAANHSAMTSRAWCGWFAVKLLWESATRAGSADAPALRAFLASTRAAFDGHKGAMLRFDETRVLRQPLYEVKVVNGKKQVSEIDVAPRRSACS
ncbi:MAG TPA: hypothetical protein VF021_11685 [Longimicrobiales bacterium]